MHVHYRPTGEATVKFLKSQTFTVLNELYRRKIIYICKMPLLQYSFSPCSFITNALSFLALKAKYLTHYGYQSICFNFLLRQTSVHMMMYVINVYFGQVYLWDYEMNVFSVSYYKFRELNQCFDSNSYSVGQII